jgi:surface protein
MSNMFRGAESFNGDLSKWNVSNVTNMVFNSRKFNMKAGELERLKLAKRYRNAERLLEHQRKNESILPEYTGMLQEVTLQSKGISGKMNNGGGGGATGGLRGKKTDSTAKFRVAGIVRGARLEAQRSHRPGRERVVRLHSSDGALY